MNQVQTDEAFDTLLQVATAIVDNYTASEEERGRPYPETYEHPSTGKTEINGVTVNVSLLRQLRGAVKALN